jgi:RNA polymerase sigma-70 factor (ECF subfamily)
VDEKAVIALAQDGDIAAFERLVRLYETRVYTLALRMTGEPSDAFDVSQDAFLRLHGSIGSYRGESAFSTWLYRLTTNVALDFLRKRKRRANREVPLSALGGGEASPTEIPDPDTPERALERSTLREALQEALDSLTHEHRQILLLREIGGLSYEEIAAALDLEPGTVKSRLARAREQMRQKLINSGNIPNGYNV